MKLSDLPINPTPRALRQFAAAWLVFFLAAGGLQYWSKGRAQLGAALAVMAVVIGVAGLMRPALVRWIFVSWMVLAFPIGWVVSQVVLLLMYYGVLSPVAVFMRLRGRDVLNRKPTPERTTFWAPKEVSRDVRSYFKQY